MFGIGGSEWLVIATVVIVLLLVPGVLVFGAGFLLGKKSGEKRAEVDTHAEPDETEAARDTELTEAPADGDTDV